MGGIQGIGSVEGAQHTREAQEARFKGYSVEIGVPSGTSASSVPEVHVRTHRSIGQMLTDWWNGVDKESRKLDALIEFIGTGEAYKVDGSEVTWVSQTADKRLSVLDQVLKSDHATPQQKKDAVAAFVGFVKSYDFGLDVDGIDDRAFCAAFMDFESGLSPEDQGLVADIGRAMADKLLASSGVSYVQLVDNLNIGHGDAPDALQPGWKGAFGLLEKYSLGGDIAKLLDAKVSEQYNAIQDRLRNYSPALKDDGSCDTKAHAQFVSKTLEQIKELRNGAIAVGSGKDVVSQKILPGINRLVASVLSMPPGAESIDKNYHAIINSTLNELGRENFALRLGRSSAGRFPGGVNIRS